MDLACSIQQVCEEVVLRMARHAHSKTGLDKLCMAGGVALNAVANGRLAREGPFADIWVQPAAGDAGGALGAAYSAVHKYFGVARPAHNGRDSMQGMFLGPSFSPDETRTTLLSVGADFDEVETSATEDLIAELIDNGKVVGWFQGRMEFGPRALGARSILADARDPRMQSTLNHKIKFREGFRPFAPSVLAERATEYFDMTVDSPYMTFVVPVAHAVRVDTPDHQPGLERIAEIRSSIPAVTHLDYSARVQTVARDVNPTFHSLISRFADRTGCPLVVNTSFNVRGEPIVATPRDAFACFARTALDCLVIGPFVLRRETQSASALAFRAAGAVGID
jgi:carbamoyltransferase